MSTQEHGTWVRVWEKQSDPILYPFKLPGNDESQVVRKQVASQDSIRKQGKCPGMFIKI